jgi:hypothetical protein
MLSAISAKLRKTSAEREEAEGVVTMAKAKPAGSRGWYVVQQHDQVELVEASEQPTTEVEAGERIKAVYGPFHDKAAADKRAAAIRSRTLASWTGQE